MERKKSFETNHSSTFNAGILIVLLVIAFIVHYPFALSGEEYVKIIGGDKDDIGNCIKFDSGENSFIFVGSTKSFGFGYANALITKWTRSGPAAPLPFLVHDWSRAIGRAQVNDQANGVAIDNDGSYVLCGFVTDRNSNQDVLLAKYTRSGINVFAKTYDVTSENSERENDWAQKLIVDGDNNYVIVGTTYSTDPQNGNILVAKFSDTGDFLMGKTIGIIDVIDRGMAITQDSWGDYVVVGYSNTNIVIIKLSPVDLAIIGSVEIFWANWDSSIPFAVIDDPSTLGPTYVVAGWAKKPNRNRKLLIFKINSTLDRIDWGKVLLPPATLDFKEEARSLIKTSQGNFVVSGLSQEPIVVPGSPYLPSSALFTSIDRNGNLNWTKTMTDISPKFLFTSNGAYCITSAPDSYIPSQNVYVATGFTARSHLGHRDLLVASFSDNTIRCFNNVGRDLENITGEISPFVMEKHCALVPYDISEREITPDIRIICGGILPLPGPLPFPFTIPLQY